MEAFSMSGQERLIQLKKGEKTEVRLHGGASGGYEWYEVVDNKKLVKIDKKYAKDDQQLAGSSADEIVTIEALDKGTTKVHFNLQRSWEKEGHPKKELTFIIDIK